MLRFFEEVTVTLGQLLRRFVWKTCKGFDTRELPKENAARGRRQAARASKTTTQSTAKGAAASKRKTLNLNTYKLHALGDYPNTIRRFGTTDSYTTQTV
jgi:hypothetical protein